MVMAAVDVEMTELFAELGGGAVGVMRSAKGGVGLSVAGVGNEAGEAGAGGDLERVSFEDGAVRGVVNVCAYLRGDVLEEGAAAPDVEGLGALADGEDRLVQVEGVLNEELIDVGAQGVGRGGVRTAGLGVFLRIDVGGGTGEEDAVAGGEDFGDALRGLVERNGDGRGSGGVEGVEVLRKGAEVVGGGVRDVL